jgi:hypothetical protein
MKRLAGLIGALMLAAPAVACAQTVAPQARSSLTARADADRLSGVGGA